jgi:hypothetical protein
MQNGREFLRRQAPTTPQSAQRTPLKNPETKHCVVTIARTKPGRSYRPGTRNRAVYGFCPSNSLRRAEILPSKALDTKKTYALYPETLRSKPYDARLMRCYPVSTRINYVANDDAECSAPVELTQTQVGLFSKEPGDRRCGWDRIPKL